MIRAGRLGERTDWALENGLVGGGWDGLPDLSSFREDREGLSELVESIVGSSKSRVANYTGQLWSMINRIKVDDFMVLSIKSTSQIAIGRVTKAYWYDPSEPDLSRRHRLGVDWIRTDIPKSLVKQDLLYQLGSALTVFQVGNSDAEYRLGQLLEGKPDPGARSSYVIDRQNAEVDENLAEPLEEALNFEELAQDEIARRLQEDFKGHDLSELVTALLECEGFTCRNSPPGADGGVDVLAGMGPLGMDSPRLVVQVKSQSGAVSDTVLQQLNGAINRYQADQALLVTFGGVTGPAKNYLETQYFSVRVWTLGEILRRLFEHYPKLSDEIRAKVPIKQIWVPFVTEDET